MRMLKRLLALLCCLFMMVPALAEDEDSESESLPLMQVHQINLGFADGYLIRVGELNILIDGGNAIPEQPTNDLMDYLAATGITRLDAYIITHWHLDHCMNLNKVLAVYGDAETVVYAPSEQNHPDYEPLANEAAYAQMVPGDVLEYGDLSIHCVGPVSLLNKGCRNQDSLNFVLQYGEFRMLFTGDFAASLNINKDYYDLCANVDVLKFPHHGMEPFEIGEQAIRTTSPKYVLVPGVANKFKVWDFMDDHGAKLPQGNVLTVADGNIVLLVDGAKRLDVRTQVTLGDLEALE